MYVDPKANKPPDWEEGRRNFQNKGMPDIPKSSPRIDPIVSEIVGKDVLANDPRLIKWAASKAKRNRSETEPTNMLADKVNRRELKEIFGGKHIL